MLNMLRKMSGNDISENSAAAEPAASEHSSARDSVKESVPTQPANRLFHFSTLHDVTRLAHVAASVYTGDSTLYKDETGGAICC